MVEGSPFKAAVTFSLVMLGGVLAGALAGGFLAVIVATFSPDLASEVFHSRGLAGGDFDFVAFGVGMFWGGFVGLAVTGFGCFLATCLGVARVLADGIGKARNPEPPGKEATAQQQ